MGRQRAIRAVLFSGAIASSFACGPRDAPPRTDSLVDSVRVSAAPAGASRWASELGQLLIVPSDSDNVGVVLYPDEPNAALITSAPLILANAAGDTTRVKLIASDAQQCGDAPVVRLTGPGPASWSVGLLGRTAKLLGMDSIEALPSADSARLAADLARLASALPTRNSRFSGLPFAVLGAHRFATNGRQFLTGHLVRRLNQEAAPLEERTLIIAERPATAGAGPSEPYAVSYSARSEGSEDSAEHFETLAAIAGREFPMILLARDQLSRTNYDLLERSADGSWRVRWSRALAC
jgi:hypothetical protein